MPFIKGKHERAWEAARTPPHWRHAAGASGQALTLSPTRQALGFHVWVAELELLVGTARAPGQAADGAACLELLQKLQATLEGGGGGGGGVARVREYQRRCEDALAELLLKGAAPPVRPDRGRAGAGVHVNAC
jgi:hypothetical protein